MFLYELVTNTMWLWIAYVVGVVGTVLLCGYLLLDNSRNRRCADLAGQLAVLGLTMLVISLVICGLYAACYGHVLDTIIAVGLLVEVLISAVLLNTIPSRKASRRK